MPILSNPYATAASPFLAMSDSSLSDGPCGRFSPRSHWLTRPVVTLRWRANTAWLALGITNGRVALRGCQCSEVYAIIAFMDAASPQPTTDPAESLVRIVQGLV